MLKITDQGINNFIVMVENAKYLALAGKYDEALTQLEVAIDHGWLGYVPIAQSIPIFEPLRDEPRFFAIEAAMVDNINAQRDALGLEPVDPLNQL